jgi:hypothetical protein
LGSGIGLGTAGYHHQQMQGTDQLMDGAPYDFIINHEETDLKKLLQFKHRTFNDIDTLYFISFFRYHYSKHDSLEACVYAPNANKTLCHPER